MFSTELIPQWLNKMAVQPRGSIHVVVLHAVTSARQTHDGSTWPAARRRHLGQNGPWVQILATVHGLRTSANAATLPIDCGRLHCTHDCVSGADGRRCTNVGASSVRPFITVCCACGSGISSILFHFLCLCQPRAEAMFEIPTD